MDFTSWIPGLVAAVGVALLVWLVPRMILAQFTKALEHGNDKRLEVLRAEHRDTAHNLVAQLKAKETELAVLRAGALTSMANRQMALDQRRLEAVEQIWSAVIVLGRAKYVSSIMSVTKLGPAADLAKANPDAREVFEIIGSKADPKVLFSDDVAKARPFVSEMTWALFNAYQTIISHAVLKLEFIKSGLGGKDLIDQGAISRVIKSALPDQVSYIERYGDAGYHNLLDALEVRLLEEMRRSLRGIESDKASVEQAAVILRASSEINQSTQRSGAHLEG